MNAFLLAAGYGSRLGNITLSTPKCLLKVGEHTMLEHWIQKLDQLGVKHFFINTHHLASKVSHFLASHPFKDRIEIIHEPELLGTAGTITENLQKLVLDDCVIVHVDNYCDDSLFEMLSTFKSRPQHVLMTLLAFRSQHPERCGVVVTNKSGLLMEFYEKIMDPPTNLANGAVYLVSRDFLQKLFNSSKKYDFSKDVMPKMLGRANVYETQEYFEDIGTPESWFRAIEFQKSKKGSRQALAES